MSGASSSAAAWSTLLDPAGPPMDLARRPDDPRLGEIVEFWKGDPQTIQPGRAVLVGFPQDEGVKRNHGRPGAAAAPQEIRRWLYRLAPWCPVTDVDLTERPPLDLGNVRTAGDLEQSQQALAAVVAQLLRAGAVPVVLGGGHETAYGHYLGYVTAGQPVGVVNIDAHLDVRPLIDGKGHSGSPFRQMLQHPTQPLAPRHYVCLGVQPHSISRNHWNYVRTLGCIAQLATEMVTLEDQLAVQVSRLAEHAGLPVYLTIDADAFHVRDVPGVSAPNVRGFSGVDAFCCAAWAGRSPAVTSFDLVEINPRYDRDGQSARWAALVIWHFLIGLATRRRHKATVAQPV